MKLTINTPLREIPCRPKTGKTKNLLRLNKVVHCCILNDKRPPVSSSFHAAEFFMPYKFQTLQIKFRNLENQKSFRLHSFSRMQFSVFLF